MSRRLLMWLNQSGLSFNKWSLTTSSKYRLSSSSSGRLIDYFSFSENWFSTFFPDHRQTSHNYSTNRPWSDEWISGECRSYTQVWGEREKKRDLIKFLTFNSKNHSIVTTRRGSFFLELKSTFQLFFLPSFFVFFSDSFSESLNERIKLELMNETFSLTRNERELLLWITFLFTFPPSWVVLRPSTIDNRHRKKTKWRRTRTSYH